MDTSTPASAYPHCPIYFNAEWAYRSAESDRDACMVSTADDLARQIDSMQAQGYTVNSITALLFCGNCQGSGRIATRKFMTYKPCPVCKGHDGPMASRVVFTSKA